MDNNNKKEKILISKLKSNNKSLILEALKEIENTGTVSLIPYIFNLITDNIDNDVKEKVFFILSNIHNKNAPEYYVKALQNNDFGSLKSDVISLCWQSSLDFGPYIELFVKIFINAQDFKTALEAYTVIENSLDKVTAENLNKSLEILKSSNSSIELVRSLQKKLIDIINKMI